MAEPWETAPSAYDEEELERTDGFEPWEVAPTPAELAYQQQKNRAPRRTKSEEVFRQTALGARYFLETPGLTVASLGDMLGGAVSAGAQALGLPYRHTPVAPRVYEGWSRMGFPEPENKTERYTERASRAVVGTGMGIATGQAMAAGTGVPAAVGTVLTEAPVLQGVGSATGALGGQAVEEAGGGPGAQMAAEIVTGMAPSVGLATTKMAGDVIVAGRDTMTRPGNARIVGDTLRDQASNSRLAQQRLEGSTAIAGQTSAEHARDPGLLAFERSHRATAQGAPYAARDSERNLRRHRILDVMGGDDVEVARRARDATASVQREAIFNEFDQRGLRTPGWLVAQKIDDIRVRPDMRQEAVEQALDHFKGRIEELVDPSGSMNVRTLYALRKDINSAMEGRLGQDKQQFRLASKALIEVKNEIDDIIEGMVPGWKKYLDDYASMSRDIDQREIIQRIQRDKIIKTAVDPETQRSFLSLAGLKSAVAKEIDAGNLTHDQLRVLTTIVDDMDSGAMFMAANVKPPGSDTARNLTMAHVFGRVLPARVLDAPLTATLTRPFAWILKASEDQIQELLTDAMLDPVTARILLSEANERNAKRLALALKIKASERGMVLGATTGAIAEDSPDGNN